MSHLAGFGREQGMQSVQVHDGTLPVTLPAVDGFLEGQAARQQAPTTTT
jgi:hypothetical protein